MKRLTTFAIAVLAVLALAPAAQAEFGVEDFQLGFTKADSSPAALAGSHPYAVVNRLLLKEKIDPELGGVPDGALKGLSVQLPEGLVGDPRATPQCTSADFINIGFGSKLPACSNDSAVGTIITKLYYSPGKPGEYFSAPVYNLVPPSGVVQKLGFTPFGVPVAIEFTVNPKSPYNVTAKLDYLAQPLPIKGSKLTVWGNPADPSHDLERGTCIAAISGEPVEKVQTTGQNCPSDAPERPFITLPRACDGPLTTVYRAFSWENPADWVEGEAESPALEDCDELGFGPQIGAESTAKSADSPSGLDFTLDIDDKGLLSPTERADSDMEKTVVTLPEGITTNPAAASGLGACTLAQYESETVRSEPGTGCPEDAKVGSVEIESPLVEQTVLGSIYVAKQGDNPFHNLLTIYMVAKNPELGALIQAAGKVEPDPVTGQLTTTFEDLPQLPFSHFRLHFREGERAPLITPPTCGTYEVTAELYPYANPGEPLHESATLQIDSGADGAPCASSQAELPHKPSFSAGTVNPLAGAFSPFVFKLSREDGSQRLSSISTVLPKGLVGRLAGIPYCPEAAIATALSRDGEGEGAVEQAAPSCPAASEVGTVNVGAGAGDQPLYVQGRAYLAGPYKGAPLSLVIVTPAIAGPFDLGTVAVRTALHVDSESAQITAVSDPIPAILHGLPLGVRSVAVNMARPGFTLNPTSCEPKSVDGTATSTLGTIAPLSHYFQTSECRRLAFEPELALRLRGGTKRSSNPALTATLTYPKGLSSNIAAATVALPRSEFLDQSHIKTICTRVQFAAEQCPKGSIYGKARAISPLLDKPLEGPVYLRSSSHQLPDLVAALDGQIEVDLVGRIDSVKGGGIRTSFEGVPDAPVSKFVLSMAGGKKGLLVNSRNICARPQRATAEFTAQNGRINVLRPLLKARCGKHGKQRKRVSR